MKVVLDTNVIVSGFLWKGAPYQLLKIADSGELEIFIPALHQTSSS